MIKRVIWLGAALALLSLWGCSADQQQDAIETDLSNSGTAATGSTVEKAAADTETISDLATLYADEDPYSVVTMYLTVSRGDAAQNLDHSWEEVNSYSVYDYEDMQVDRYAVSGLLQVGDENGPLAGDFGYEAVVPNATVTIRGQSSSQGAQKNYKIKLLDGSGSWRDQTVINLNKHMSEGLRFRNKLSYDLLKLLPDTLSAQTQFVHLYVKDLTAGEAAVFTDYGLYTQVEQINKSYLKRHGLDNNGQLYKINFFEFQRYPDVIMLKSEENYDQAAFETMLEIKGSDDHSKLIAMLDDLNNVEIPIEEVIAEWFNKDNLLTWLAYQTLMGNKDTQSRNLFLYSPLNSQTWYFISWDNDGSLSTTENSIRDRNINASWAHGMANYWGNTLFNRLLRSEQLRAELDTKMQEVKAVLTPELMSSMIQNYAAVVKPYVYSGPDLLHAPLTATQYDEVVTALPSEIEANYQAYRQSLQEPMPFYIGIPTTTANTVTLTWDAAFDFNQENITYSLELADNIDFTKPLVQTDQLILPSYTYEGKLEPGQYFVRIQATNESGYSQAAFDYYVLDGANLVSGVLSFYILADGSVEVVANAEN
ncbi:MAG: CotH kinase family protein [Oscillospiraceae bacterium]|nr:CotH kinase family protein [Oscillospiraceae bacterium]